MARPAPIRSTRGTVLHTRHSLRLWPWAMMAALLSNAATALPHTWSGSAADPFWDLPANWLNGLPLVGDVALLGAANTTVRNTTWDLLSLTGTGTLTLSGGVLALQSASSVGSLALAGGMRGGAGELLAGSLGWTSGSLGSINFTGGQTTVSGLASLTANGHSVNYGHVLTLNGNTTFGGNGQLFIGSADLAGGITPYGDSRVVLAAGKTLTVQGDTASSFLFYGGGSFVNGGTVNMAASGKLLYIDTPFSNAGTLAVAAGEVQLRNVRSIGGSVQVAAGSTLRFNGGTTFAPDLVLTNAGSVVFDGSYNVLGSGLMTVGGTTVQAGRATGGAGSMVLDTWLWNGGSLGYSGSLGGSTRVGGLATLSDSSHSVAFGHSLQLAGNALWATSGQLFIDGAGIQNNVAYGASSVSLAAGKTLTLQGNDSTAFLIYGNGSFNNAGTVVKSSGSSTLFLDGNFNNSGILRAAAGSVQVRGRIDNTGEIHADGARIEITQPGALAQWNGAAQTLTGGTYRVTGSQPMALNLGFLSGTATPALIRSSQARILLEGAGAALVVTTTSPAQNALLALASNEGLLSLKGGATLATQTAFSNQAGGTLVLGAGSSLVLGGSAAQSGAASSSFVGGRFNATAMSFAAGVLSAGDAAGQIGAGLLEAPSVSFGAALRFEQDLAGGDWDRLAVTTGNLTLGGTLDARFAAGMGAGTYRFLTVSTGQVSGSFSQVLSNLDPTAYAVAAVYGPNFVDLSVTPVSELPTYALLVAGLLLIGWRASSSRSDGDTR